MKNRIAAWLMTAVLAVTTVGADASIVFADNPDVAAESVVEKTEEGSLDSGEVTDSADNENLTDVVNENAESISDSVSQPDSMTATEEGEEVNTPHSEEEKLPESVPASADSDTVQSSSEATGGEGIVEEGSEPTAAPAVEESGEAGISSINGESIYLLSVDDEKGQMIQSNSESYYYGFVPEKTGYYTVYLSGGQLSDAYFHMVDAEGTDISFEDENGTSQYEVRFPGSLTCKLTEGETVYFRIYCYSNNGSKSYVKIREKAEPDEVTLADLLVDTTSYTYGQKMSVRINLNRTDFNAVSACVRDASGNTWSSSQSYPQKADAEGYYTLNWVDMNAAGELYLDQISVYDQYGYQVNVTLPESYTNTPLFTVSQLQNDLNQLSENGGGVYSCYSYDVQEGETLTIPENVTLKITKLNVTGTLNVKGNVVAYDLELPTSSSILADAGKVVVTHSFCDYKGDTPDNLGITGYYGAYYYCTADHLYNLNPDLEWRHGKWREPMSKRNGIPENDEITVIDNALTESGVYSNEGISTEPELDTHWYSYTPENDTMIQVSASLGNASDGSLYAGVMGTSSFSYISSVNINGYNSQPLVLSLQGGKTFYFYIESHGSEAAYAFTAELKENVVTADSIAAALDFENASYSVMDIEGGVKKREVSISIPVITTDQELLDAIANADIYYNAIDQEGKNLWLWGKYDSSAGNCVITTTVNAYSAVAETLLYEAEYLLFSLNGSSYYIRTLAHQGESDVSYRIDEAYTDFGGIQQIRIENCIVEMSRIELGSETVLEPGSAGVYYFEAAEAGDYVAYLTDSGASAEVSILHNDEEKSMTYEGSFSYPDSREMNLNDGDIAYISVETYGDASAAELGITADTADIEVTDLSMDTTRAIAGQTFTMNLSCAGTMEGGAIRRAEASFERSSGNYEWIGFSANNRADISSSVNLSGSFNAEGTYKLCSLNVYDYYGRCHTFDNNSISGIDFSNYVIEIQSVNDYLSELAEAGQKEISLEQINLNEYSKSLVIPEGLTLQVNHLRMESTFANKIIANGTLIINGGDVNLGNGNSVFEKGENGAIIVNGSLCCNPVAGAVDTSDNPVITGADENARIYGWDENNSEYLEFLWRNGKWKKIRSDGYVDLDEMEQLEPNAAGAIVWTAPAGNEPGSIWFKFKVSESGAYKAVYSNMELAELAVANSDNTYTYIDGYYPNGSRFFFAAGEQIVIRGYTFNSGNAQFSFIREEGSGISGESLAADIDAEKVKASFENSDGIHAAVKMTVPLKGVTGGFADLFKNGGEDLEINAGLSGDSRSSRMKGTFDADANQLTLTGNVMLAGYEAGTMSLEYINLERFTDYDNWNEYSIYNQEEVPVSSVQTHALRTGYIYAAGASVSLPAGRNLSIDNTTGLFTAYTGDARLSYYFTPKESGYYCVVTDEEALDWSCEFCCQYVEEGTIGWDDCGNELEAGETYRLDLWVEDASDGGRPYGTPVQMEVTMDRAEAELTSVVIPETAYQNTLPETEVTVSIQNGEAAYAELYFGKDPYVEDGNKEYNEYSSMYLVSEDGTTFNVKESYLYDVGEWELYQVNITDKNGKRWAFTDLAGKTNRTTLKVESLKDYLESARSGDNLSFNSIEMSSEEPITIPEGVVVNVNNLRVYNDAVLNVEGTLNVSGTLDLYGSVKAGSHAAVTVHVMNLYNYGLDLSNGGSVQVTGTIKGNSAEDPEKWDVYFTKITGTDGVVMYPLYYEKIYTASGDDYDYAEDTSTAYNWNGSEWVLAGEEEPEPDPVEKVNLSTLEENFALAETEVTYSGAPQKPALVYNGSGTDDLLEGRDYSVVYRSNITAGKASVIISGINHYEGTITKTFTINKANRKLVPTSAVIQKTLGTAPFTIETNAWESVVYESADPAIAEVITEAGISKVQARAAGETTITVKIAESTNYLESSTEVKLTVLKESGVLKALDQAWNLGAETADNTLDISGRFRYNGAMVSDTAPVDLVYESSDPAVVTVNENGLLTGVKSGSAEIRIYAPETADYSQSNTAIVPVTVRDGVAEYNGNSYISVSSALGKITELEGEIDLLADTEPTEVLHQPSDKAVIEPGKTIILDLCQHHYYGSLKIQGKLILKNTKQSMVQKAKAMLNALFGVVIVNAADENETVFNLDGGSLEIQDSAEGEVVQIQGDTASITTTEGDTTSTTYYAKVEDAIGAANEMTDPGTGGEGTPASDVTVKLTNPAVLTESANMNAGVKLDLAGNTLGTDAGGEAKLSGAAESIVSSSSETAAVSASVLENKNLVKEGDSAVTVVEDSEITIPYEVKLEQTYEYDGNAPQLELVETGDTNGFTVLPVESDETKVGTHTYSANILYNGVVVKTLSGDVEITKAQVDISSAKLEDRIFHPDGEVHNLEITDLSEEAGGQVAVSYKNNAQSEQGNYEVTAVITLKDDDNYVLLDGEQEVTAVARTAEMTIAHTPGKRVKKIKTEATCYSEGTYDLVVCCTEPGCDEVVEVLSENEVLSRTNNHIKSDAYEKENVIEPTCAKAGSYQEVYYCTECAAHDVKTVVETVNKTIPATGVHTYDDGKVTKEPTCVEEGVKTFTCGVCGDTKTESIPATGKHTEVKDAADAATTAAAGKTAGSHCSVCGQVLNAQKSIAKIGALTLSSKSFTYNGKAQKPTVTVKDAAGKAIAASNYTVKYDAGCTNAGSYKATVTFKGSYSGSLSETFTIAKAKPTVKVKTVSKKLKLKKVKKKKQSFAIGASVTGNGKLSYKISKYKGKAKKYIKINKSNGKITVKKKTPKGTYKVTVQVTAAASANYNAATLSKTIKVVVK